LNDLTSFTELIKIAPKFRKEISKLHTDFKDIFMKKSLPTSELQEYEKRGFCISKEIVTVGTTKYTMELVKFPANEHVDGANFRKIFECNNIVEYLNYDPEQKIFTVTLVEAGPGPRTLSYAVARVALQPICDDQDIIREQRVKNKYVLQINQKFQDFIRNNQNFIKKEKPVFNFTDSLYYINDLEFNDFKNYPDNSIIGFGTAHIYKRDGPLRFGNKIFGYVKTIDNEMEMQVKGNYGSYKHNKILNELKDKNQAILLSNNVENPNQFIKVLKTDFVDFGATLYVKFTIVKSKFSNNPSLTLMNNEESIPIVKIGLPPYEENIILFRNEYIKVLTSIEHITQARALYFSANCKSAKDLVRESIIRQRLLDLNHLKIIAKIVHEQIQNLEEE
jgi:hypothetical protein